MGAVKGEAGFSEGPQPQSATVTSQDSLRVRSGDMQENVGVGEETSVVERGLRDDRESPRVSKESLTQQSGNDKPQPTSQGLGMGR